MPAGAEIEMRAFERIGPPVVFEPPPVAQPDVDFLAHAGAGRRQRFCDALLAESVNRAAAGNCRQHFERDAFEEPVHVKDSVTVFPPRRTGSLPRDPPSNNLRSRDEWVFPPA